MMPRFSIQRGLAFVLRKQPFSAMKVKEVKEAPPPKRANIHLAVDKPHEGKTLREIIRLPPSALQGLAEHSDKFLGGFDIRSIKDLGIIFILHVTLHCLSTYSLIYFTMHRKVEGISCC